MQAALDFLSRNQGALSVLFTAMVTVATICYVVLTRQLVAETKLLREVQTEPRIEVTVRPLDFAVNIVRLYVKNIGLGPAVDVRLRTRVLAGGTPAESLLKEFTEAEAFQHGIAYLSPGEERYSPFTHMAMDAEGKLDAVFEVDLSYKSATGRSYGHPVRLSMSELKGMYQLGTPHLYSIAQSLEKLQ